MLCYQIWIGRHYNAFFYMQNERCCLIFLVVYLCIHIHKLIDHACCSCNTFCKYVFLLHGNMHIKAAWMGPILIAILYRGQSRCMDFQMYINILTVVVALKWKFWQYVYVYKETTCFEHNGIPSCVSYVLNGLWLETSSENISIFWMLPFAFLLLASKVLLTDTIETQTHGAWWV